MNRQERQHAFDFALGATGNDNAAIGFVVWLEQLPEDEREYILREGYMEPSAWPRFETLENEFSLDRILLSLCEPGGAIERTSRGLHGTIGEERAQRIVALVKMKGFLL